MSAEQPNAPAAAPPLAKGLHLANAQQAPHPEHRGLGFRDPDDEDEPGPSHGSPKDVGRDMPAPAKRQYREKPRSADADREPRSERRAPAERTIEHRERPRDHDRSPVRDRRPDDRRDREDSRRGDGAARHSRDEPRPADASKDRDRVSDRPRTDDRDRERERERRYSRDDRDDDRRDGRRESDARRSGGDERRREAYTRRSASPPPREERIGDFKNWVPMVGGETARRPRPDDAGDEPMPELYAVLRGTIASVQSFGAFVKFEGRKRQGLVHVSQLSNFRVENPRDMVAEGDAVWVKVVGVSEEEGKKKISLSMKLVNQTTGQDLDANNVALTMSQRKRGGGGAEKGPMELGYALPTVCAKCGGAGHLAAECKVGPGGAHYELLPEPAPGAREPEQRHPHSHHKDKKEKKDKKHKKHRKEKKEKKHKKKHKKHHSSSDSSSSSSSSSSDSD